MINKRILVVEDLAVARDFLCQVLKSLGCVVVATADTGSKAIEAYQLHKPDLMTLDISLPDIDGLFVLKEIKRAHPDSKVLVVTANNQEMLRKEIISLGALGVILKPFGVKEVQEALQNAFPT
jgi:two-component system chemotaxis response regulator CheY